jgi:hypothetical protein
MSDSYDYYIIIFEFVDRLEKGDNLKRSLGMAFPTLPEAYGFEAATQSQVENSQIFLL